MGKLKGAPTGDYRHRTKWVDDIKDIAENQVLPPQLVRVSPSDIITSEEAEAMTSDPKEVKYVIASQWQRNLMDNHSKAIADLYNKVPDWVTTEIITVGLKGQYPNLRYVADGDHRMDGVRKNGKPKTFRLTHYKECTMKQAAALFDMGSSRRNTELSHRMESNRPFSPVYQLYKSEQETAVSIERKTIPFTMVFHTSEANPKPTAYRAMPIMQWKQVLDGWERGMCRAPVTPANLHQVRDASTDNVLEYWGNSMGIRVLREISTLVWVITICFAKDCHKKGLTDKDALKIGVKLARLFNPKNDLTKGEEEERVKLMREVALMEHNNASRKVTDRPDPNFFKAAPLSVLFMFIRYHGWDELLKRIPKLINGYDQETLLKNVSKANYLKLTSDFRDRMLFTHKDIHDGPLTYPCLADLAGCSNILQQERDGWQPRPVQPQ
jgi:hypothetical protein